MKLILYYFKNIERIPCTEFFGKVLRVQSARQDLKSNVKKTNGKTKSLRLGTNEDEQVMLDK